MLMPQRVSVLSHYLQGATAQLHPKNLKPRIVPETAAITTLEFTIRHPRRLLELQHKLIKFRQLLSDVLSVYRYE